MLTSGVAAATLPSTAVAPDCTARRAAHVSGCSLWHARKSSSHSPTITEQKLSKGPATQARAWASLPGSFRRAIKHVITDSRISFGSSGCGRARIPSTLRGLFIQLEPADSVNPATRIPSTSPPASFNHADSVHPETRIHSSSPPGFFNPRQQIRSTASPRHDSFNPKP